MLNNVTVMGRLVAFPELKTTQSGKSVTSFTVACGRDYNHEVTDWIDCVAWDKTAEFISNYFGKGSMIAIVGSIQTRNYEDKNGNKRKAVEVVVNNAYFAESKKISSGSSAPVNETNVSSTDDESDLPF